MIIAIELASIVVLSSALIGELKNDSHGDIHDKNNKDIYWRIAIVLVSSFVSWLINRNHSFLQNVVMATAIFTAFFSYVNNYIEHKNNITGKNARWWSYLNNTTYPDKSIIWKAIPWPARMLLYTLILIAGIIIYAR